MSAYLTYPGESGVQRILCGPVTTIGRDRNNDIVLPDLRVSRNHALVRRLGEADYYFIDSGSSNGSRLNDRRVTMPTLLHSADRILIGTTEFVFEQEAPCARFSETASFQATVIVAAPLIQEITILVADIRGYTALSEQLSIRTLTRVMNQWFEQVSEVIGGQGGVVDKFIGDCVFARWEGEDSRENVLSALRAACRLRTVTAALGAAFPELQAPLRMGVGINTGMASLGVGSDNTALGDAVNIAFRLESASKELGVDVVLSESACAALPERCRRDTEQEIRLKGKRRPVKVVGLHFEEADQLLGKSL
jgi:adenylate cyclase